MLNTFWTVKQVYSTTCSPKHQTPFLLKAFLLTDRVFFHPGKTETKVFWEMGYFHQAADGLTATATRTSPNSQRPQIDAHFAR